jgi:hypothetical protein
VTGTDGAPRVPLSISKTITASNLRKEASETTKIPVAALKLIFRGRLIGDDDSKQAVPEFKLEEGSVVHCMGKPAGSQSPAPAASTPAARASLPAQPNLNFIPPTTASHGIPTPPADPLKAALQTLRSSCSPEDYLTSVTTLDKVLSNITSNPLEEKYRKVKKQNAAFQRRLGGRNGGDAAMKAAGFLTNQEDGEEIYFIEASAEAWPKLMATKATVEAAVRDATAASTTAPPQASAPVGAGVMPAGGMPGFGGMGGPMGSPDMERAVSDLMSNPTQMQAMLQV